MKPRAASSNPFISWMPIPCRLETASPSTIWMKKNGRRSGARPIWLQGCWWSSSATSLSPFGMARKPAARAGPPRSSPTLRSAAGPWSKSLPAAGGMKSAGVPGSSGSRSTASKSSTPIPSLQRRSASTRRMSTTSSSPTPLAPCLIRPCSGRSGADCCRATRAPRSSPNRTVNCIIAPARSSISSHPSRYWPSPSASSSGGWPHTRLRSRL
ncbi:MAG: hypothetical protein BWY77_00715 [bacterium ADurb.Bin431]|nr:MAG: hypothetical protein BWY77_00715 [bacterium ADurb.Bin431]